MKRHLLYVAAPEQIELTKANLTHIRAENVKDASNFAETYVIKHKYMGKMELQLHLLSDLDGITPHLRQSPVDLLIYDERGPGGIDALIAFDRIRDDVTALAELWGPDFLFPLRRAVAILGDTSDAAHRSFLLGRDHVRDVLVAPQHLVTILRWIARLLKSDLKLETEKIGLALSGGGLEGFLFQLGAMHALERAMPGTPVSEFHVFSGVSSGSILAAILANKVPVIETIRAINHSSEILPPLKSTTVFDFATSDIAKRISSHSLRWPSMDPNKWVQRALRSVPTGLFKGDNMRTYFETVIKTFGGDDTFTSLDSELFIGGTDQDTFEHIVFGKEPWTNVKVSEAVRASCALPPFFTPSKIGGRWFIDGQVTRTCNLELPVQRGCRLIFIIDPLKPYATLEPGSVDQQGGVYALIQAVKALVYTRFRSTLKHLTERYPDVDFLVFQPDEEVAQLMSGSPMRYRIRSEIVTHAFNATLRRLRERHHVYQAKLEKYGIELVNQRGILDIERKGIKI